MKKEDFDIKAFSKRFSELLSNSDENTHTLAKKLGLSPATISRYSNGLMAPKLPTLYAMADIFDVNPIWLFGFNAPMERETSSIESADNEKKAAHNEPPLSPNVKALHDTISDFSNDEYDELRNYAEYVKQKRKNK